MANVDAEQNAAPTQQTEGAVPSGFTLSEENLEALLNGVRGGAALQKPAAEALSTNAPAGAMPKPGSLDQTTKIEPARDEEPIASLASLQGAPPMEAVAPPPFEATPVAVTPLQPAPHVAPQPDVNSKLALISAIKQRRAVTVRPEPAPETEILAPAPPAAALREHTAPDTETPSEEEVAGAPKAEAVSLKRGSAIDNAPATGPVKTATEIQPQAALPAKKIWTNGANAAPGEPEPRRAGAPPTETPRPEIAKKAAPKATVAAPAAEATDPSESSELFASFSAGIPEPEAAKPKSFITSKVGMGVIGGAIAAAALTVYFLTAHGSPKESAAVNAPATPPVEVTSTVAPAASSSDGKAQTPLAANAHATAAAPVTTQASGAKPASPAAGPPAVQPAPAGYPPQNPIAQQRPVSQQSGVAETPRTVARSFTAPSTARPSSSSPVVDAAPALAINTAAPSGVNLPTRIAPLPPPPAPAAAAPTASAPPKQLNVAGAVQASKLTRQVVPAYPAVAKAARVQGTVHFRALIGADGTVKALTTLGGPLPLAQAASEAVKQWRYKPTLVDGKPVEVTTQIDVAFSL